MEGELDTEAEVSALSIPLDPPIRHAGGSYATLELREPRVSEVQRSEEGLGALVNASTVLDAEIALVALVGGWPVQAVEELPVSVLNRATSYVSSFEASDDEIAAIPDEAVHEIALPHPVEITKGVFASMTLREPRVAERKRATAALGAATTRVSMRRAEILLVTEISGWPQAAVLKMPIGAFTLAAGFINRFLVAGRGTGASSRPT